VIDGKNILVDGAVFNNLPGNLVRDFGSGFNIVINVSPEEDLVPKHERFPSAWSALKDRLLHGEKNPGVPTILDTIIRSLLLSSTNVANAVQRDADLYLAPPVSEFGMLEFTAFEQIMEAGYRYAVDTLRYFKLPWT
jgi:NTE family protein